MEGKPQSKDSDQKYQQFGKEIGSVLKEFEKTREWADIGNWLVRLHPILATRKFGNVPHKIRLTKRLAQCLSPGIPSTIHSNALKIYSIILTNFGNKVQLLPLLSIGLFPFFEYCSTDLKFELLTIFQQYFIKTPECLQMVTSLVNALLTSFIENNEELNKRVYALCDQIAERYGRVWVDGAVWVNVLKSPKVRNAGLKYLMKSFKDRDKAMEEAREAKEDKEGQSEAEKQPKQRKQSENGKEIDQDNETNQKIKILSTRSLKKSQQLIIQVTKQPKKQEQPSETKQKSRKSSEVTENTIDPQKEGQKQQGEKKVRKRSEYKLSSEEESEEDVKEISPQVEALQKKISRKGLAIQTAESITSDMFLDQASAQARDRLLAQYQKNEDNFKTRFPNFSTLVINALCQSLQSPSSDTLTRRNTLDLILAHLPLTPQNKANISTANAIRLTVSMLQMLNLKQYSLTRRIYSYFFGQPNMEGVYEIDGEGRAYEMAVLKGAIQRVLAVEVGGRKLMTEQYQASLNIVCILLEDNQQLAPLLLPTIGFKILKFIRVAGINPQFYSQFQTQIIEPNYSIFLNSIRQKMQLESVEKRPPEAREVVLTLQHFYNIKNRVKDPANSEIGIQEAHEIIQWLLEYLQATKCAYERLSIQIIDFCTQMALLLPKGKSMNARSVEILNELIKMKPVNTIYGKILNLHPKPSKQDLLPYINEPTLAIVCIRNLLQNNTSSLTNSQKKYLFFAIFKLFRGRIWQDQAVQFQKQYKEKLGEQFAVYIDQVPPQEWLIYWGKMDGDVDGGVIRMLKSLEIENKLNRQQLRKWIEDSKHISTKLINPIYDLLLKTPNPEIEPVYKMLKRVFKGQRTEFSKLLYQNRQKYFIPLIDRIFQCIDSGNEELKKVSVDMLEFLLENTVSLDEKLIFLSITFRKTIEKLREIQRMDGQYEREIEIVEYFISMTGTFQSFKGNFQRVSVLEQIIQGEGLMPVMTEGMKMTTVPYLRTLYIQFIERSVQSFIYIETSQHFLSKIIKQTTEKLYQLLRQNNGTALEQKIMGDYHTKNDAQSSSSFALQPQSEQPQTLTSADLNLESKYAQIVQLWNCISFLYRVCIENKVENIYVLELLAFIVQAFPFAFLKFQQISERFLKEGFVDLQVELNYTSGLKKEVLAIFGNIWKSYQAKILDFLIEKSDPRILLYAKIDPAIVISSLVKSSHIETIKSYYQSQQLNIPKSVLHYNFKLLSLQTQICYFLYLYIAYANLSTLSVTGKSQHFYENFISLLKILNLSHHTQTRLWVFELLYAVCEKIGVKAIWGEGRLKGQVQGLVKDLLQEITPVIANERLITVKSEIKVGFFHKLTKEEVQEGNQKYDFPRPYPPTINKLQFLFQDSMKNLGSDSLSHAEDETKVFIFSKPAVDLPDAKYKAFLSTVCIKTYSTILFPLLSKIYENDYHKIALLCKDNLLQMLPTYSKASTDEFCQIYKESISELMRNLFTQDQIRADLIKSLRKNVLELFMEDDFFKCTPATLNYWEPVIDACTENYDLISELISKQGLFQAMFSRKNKTTEIQIKNFERVCFLIFSGRIDKYEKKLRVVLESLSRVMKAQNPSPALLILILFCIRVLFMRLSQNALNRMFRSIWPSLIALLIQIFTKSKYQNSHNLRLAGLKMIELVHALGLEQFNIHKWIFIFDYFGIKIQEQTEQEKKLTSEQHIDLLTPFKYKPILTKILPKTPLKCTYIHKQSPQPEKPSKRRLIATQTVIKSQKQLQEMAFELLQYMIDLNQCRSYTNRAQIQELIEIDFISLDSYIYEVK